jgi:uncharacterized protein
MVTSLHSTTIEVTTEERLTEKGDCIIGVGASKGCAQLDERLKAALRNDRATVLFSLHVGSEKFEFQGFGNAGLSLLHPHDMVIRKSSFLSDRTLAVGTNAAAKDIPRKIVASLRDPHATGVLKIEVR